MVRKFLPIAFLVVDLLLLFLGVFGLLKLHTVLILLFILSLVGFLCWFVVGNYGLATDIENIKNIFRQLSIGKLDINFPKIQDVNLHKLIIAGKSLVLVFTSMIGNLLSRSKLVKQISDRLEDEVQVIWQNNEDLLRLSQETSSWIENTEVEIQQIFHATGEMKKAIDEVAQRATETAQITAESSTRVQETNVIIKELGTATQEISKIVDTINQFAEQTNLLALNATIEAARAGEAGKGFAVVANEVKELAKETSKSAEEIGKIVDKIQTSVKEAVASSESITKIVNDTQEYVNILASAVEEQASMISEIDQRIGEVHARMEEIFNGILRTHSISEGLSRLVKDLSISIYSLNDTADHLEVSARLFTPNPAIFKAMQELDLDIILIAMYLRHLEWQSEVIRNGIEGKVPNVVLDIKQCPFAAKLNNYNPPTPALKNKYDYLNTVHEDLHKLGKVFVEDYLDKSLEDRLEFLNNKITPTLRELERAILDFFELYRSVKY